MPEPSVNCESSLIDQTFPDRTSLSLRMWFKGHESPESNQPLFASQHHQGSLFALLIRLAASFKGVLVGTLEQLGYEPPSRTEV